MPPLRRMRLHTLLFADSHLLTRSPPSHISHLQPARPDAGAHVSQARQAPRVAAKEQIRSPRLRPIPVVKAPPPPLRRSRFLLPDLPAAAVGISAGINEMQSWRRRYK